MKNLKIWSNLSLFASGLSVLTMALIMYGYLSESFTFREASSYLRTAAQISVFVLCFCAIVAFLSLKNKVALCKALLATLIIITPLIVLKNNMPAGTSLFAATPSGPPPKPNSAQPGDNSGGNPKTAPINDISTDTQNPPNFAAVIPLRPKGSNSIEYTQQSAAAQAAQFPDIKPITSTLDNIEAFNRALDIVRENGWEVIYQDSTSGVIEAVASTRFFNFQDDIVIRVSGNGTNSIVDIRSHSRLGRSDRGKNAERVRAFIESF